MIKSIKTFGEVESTTLEQMQNCVEGVDGADYAVLCADNHLGYSQPIGGAIAYKKHISVSGVGFDIGCGNKAVKLDIKADGLNMKEIMDKVWEQISFGVGRKNLEKVEHPVLEKIKNSPVEEQRKMYSLACDQLGTVGSGNHYVDIFKDEEGWVWVGVHFGSRGFGHKTASGFMSLAKGGKFDEAPKGEQMMDKPVIFDVDSELGQKYLQGMTLAGEYAYAGRDWVCQKVASIIGGNVVEEVHNHHNFAWKEEHFGEDYWVVRKGCTPAFPGQISFIGGTMKDFAYIIEGIDSEESREALYSTVHGAGRVMSRTQAAGKKKLVKSWQCGQRDCDGTLPSTTARGEDGSNPKCPKCESKMHWYRGWEIKQPGLVDWPKWQADMKELGIELRGGGADEAPEVYKRLDEVIESHKGTIKILHKLQPIGVAMAGINEFDPYKD